MPLPADSTSNTPTVSNIRLADFHIGTVWGNIGGNSERHVVYQQTISYRNSLFCARSIANPRLGTSRAILLPIFATGGPSISPSTCGPLGGHWTRGIYGVEHPQGSNPAIAGEVRVTGVTFVRFLTGSYVLQTMMRGGGLWHPGGMESSDAVPPHFFSRITIDSDSRTNLALLPPPHRSWIEPRKCVVMDCDGPRQVILHDLDGSAREDGRK